MSARKASKFGRPSLDKRYKFTSVIVFGVNSGTKACLDLYLGVTSRLQVVILVGSVRVELRAKESIKAQHEYFRTLYLTRPNRHHAPTLSPQSALVLLVSRNVALQLWTPIVRTG